MNFPRVSFCRARLFFFASVGAATAGWAAPASGEDWTRYLGGDDRSHYSTLTQITPANVQRLQVAWTYRPGELQPDMRKQIQCNPLVIKGVLYGTTALQKVVALDAATGRELWRFDPHTEGRSKMGDVRHRGLVYWATGNDRRIVLAHDRYLYAINADTGRLARSFGDQGMIDFKDGLATDAMVLNSGTPGVIYKNLYILPTRTSESHGSAAPGHVRAYDLNTGRVAWTFHTIPQPGEYGYESWPADAWKTMGGANCWAGMALDAERGLVYVPTGSAAYDFWGGNRHGDNLFANSLICLDARTGKRVWHYQVVRHDVWDRDLPAPPNLLTVKRDGRLIPAVAQVTKSGHVFVFNRETGEPLFPVEDRVAPSSDIPGELVARSQPVPLKPAPFSRNLLTHDDLTTRTPEAHRAAVERFGRLRQSLLFQPPSREGSIVSPGLDGGAEWGGAAVDPDGVMYVNATDVPWILTMVETSTSGRASKQDVQRGVYLQYCAACHGADRAGNRLQNIPELTGVRARLKREEVLDRIAQGKGVMPPFSFLPLTVREGLADYLLGTGAEDATAVRSPAPPAAPPVDPGSLIPWVVGGHERWVDADGYPAIKPPWGTLNAIDLNTGEYLWRTPLGEFPELTAKGVPVTGTESYGGPVVTAGGVIFIAATRDEMIRAFDRKTGRVLWQAKLPTGGYATPSTYLANGRQYVVIACGGGKLGSKSDDAYVAFALPP